MSVVLVVSTLAAATMVRAEKEPAASEIDGTYSFVSFEANGKSGAQVPTADLKETKFVFKGTNFTMHRKNEKQDMTFSVDADKKPKQIDLTRKSENGKSQSVPGIYSLEGKRLTICIDETGKLRPKEFVTKGFERTSMLVLEKD
jgi:uncharacterized protein (TIGR03067 family)